MKDAEDEAFDELARRQGDWGGGFQAKRAMAAAKLQDGKCKYCVDGCIACDARAQPAQEQWKCVGPPCKCNASTAKQCCYAVFTTPPKREWANLTEQEWLNLGCSSVEEVRIGLAIQAKLKEKNT